MISKGDKHKTKSQGYGAKSEGCKAKSQRRREQWNYFHSKKTIKRSDF